MNNAKRYFEKAHIIFDLLKDGDEVPIEKIKQELNVSNTVVSAALNEFNLFENTIQYMRDNKVKFVEKKKSLTDCKTYNVYSTLLKQILSDPEHYLFENEVEIAKELGVERNILQKLKTLIKMESKKS